MTSGLRGVQGEISAFLLETIITPLPAGLRVLPTLVSHLPFLSAGCQCLAGRFVAAA